MRLKHHVYMHGSWLWKVMERQMEKLKDRTESFDDLFPCRSHGVKVPSEACRELAQSILRSPSALIPILHPKNKEGDGEYA
ncbi:MAG TPA: hypothetical protein VJN71_11250 [Nitrososphaerales archaeon]|nr:hypothetical protein [Nitrososphaerales archaeon]